MPVSIKQAIQGSTGTVIKVKSFLDRASRDKVYSPRELEKTCGIGLNSLYNAARSHDFSAYKLTVSKNHVYWGNRKAITALKRALEIK